jgi:hypothetical protein
VVGRFLSSVICVMILQSICQNGGHNGRKEKPIFCTSPVIGLCRNNLCRLLLSIYISLIIFSLFSFFLSSSSSSSSSSFFLF